MPCSFWLIGVAAHVGASNLEGDLKKAIEDEKETVATLVEEIEALEAGIKALDTSVAEARSDNKYANPHFWSTSDQSRLLFVPFYRIWYSGMDSERH